jgi:hypothetical protein
MPLQVLAEKVRSTDKGRVSSVDHTLQAHCCMPATPPRALPNTA